MSDPIQPDATPAAPTPAAPDSNPDVPETPAAPDVPDVWAVPEAPTAWMVPAVGQPAPRRRPPLATVLRWSAAVLLLAGSGTATAFAVTAPARTDIPGLATPNDGRYAFAPLTLPPLPPGKPAPSVAAGGTRHFADLRQLVLPAPKGALATAPSASAPAASASPAASPSASASTAASGAPAPASSQQAVPATQQPTAVWAACSDFAKLDANPALLQVIITENACRAAATRIFTAPDGTRTEIWLQSFGSWDEAHQYYTELTTSAAPKAVPQPQAASDDLALAGLANAFPRASGTNGPGGKLPIGRYAFLEDGDVVATVVMSNPAGVLDQPFQQVVTLQSDLIG